MIIDSVTLVTDNQNAFTIGNLDYKSTYNKLNIMSVNIFFSYKLIFTKENNLYVLNQYEVSRNFVKSTCGI